MNFNINQNFARIYRTISDQGIKRTAFAKSMGYNSTSQLSSTLDGDALISTKAVIELIKNDKLNGKLMFISIEMNPKWVNNLVPYNKITMNNKNGIIKSIARAVAREPNDAISVPCS